MKGSISSSGDTASESLISIESGSPGLNVVSGIDAFSPESGGALKSIMISFNSDDL